MHKGSTGCVMNCKVACRLDSKGTLGTVLLLCTKCCAHVQPLWFESLYKFAGLKEGENIVVIYVQGTETQGSTSSDLASFVAVDFLDHPSQATAVMTGSRYVMSTCVQLRSPTLTWTLWVRVFNRSKFVNKARAGTMPADVHHASDQPSRCYCP